MVAVGRDLAKFDLAEAFRMADEEPLPKIRDRVRAAAGSDECFCSREGRGCPPDAVAEAAGAALVDDSLLPDVPWRPELDEARPLVS